MKKLNATGFAHHIALMAVVVVVAIGGIGSYVFLKGSSADSFSAICGSGYSLKHVKQGSGFQIRNYKKTSATRNKTGCAIVVNSPYGSKTKKLGLQVWANTPISGGKACQYGAGNWTCHIDEGPFTKYAGPIYYHHKSGVYMYGWKNSSARIQWKLTTN